MQALKAHRLADDFIFLEAPPSVSKLKVEELRRSVNADL